MRQQSPLNMLCENSGEEGWYGIPNLLILRDAASIEAVGIRERLDSRSFPNRQRPVLFIVKETTPVWIALRQDGSTEAIGINASVTSRVIASSRPLHSLWEKVMGNIPPAPARRNVPNTLQVLFRERTSNMVE